jgi:hypothetical protein
MKFVPYEMKTSVIAVHSYEGKTLRGTITNPYFKEPVAFENVIQLVLIIDELQDSLNFPQESMKTRSFVEEPDGAPASAAVMKTASEAGLTGAPIASFKINVMFRQNASWQGGIVWLDTQTESQFRSLLELIMLLDGAIMSAISATPS